MKITHNRHTPKRVAVSGFVRRFVHRYASPSIPAQRFIAEVRQRISSNIRFRITANNENGFTAFENNFNRIIEFKTEVFHGRNFATLIVKWDEQDPTLLDLDSIRDAFFGEVYTMIQLNFQHRQMEACIIHCLDDQLLPRTNGY